MMPIIMIKDASISFLHHSQYVQTFVRKIYEIVTIIFLEK